MTEYTNYGILGGLRGLFYNALQYCDDCFKKNQLIRLWNEEIADINKNEVPTANGIDIVRCKDCMYFSSSGIGWCMNDDIRYGYVNGDDATTFEPDEDFWCKYGKRKESDGFNNE